MHYIIADIIFHDLNLRAQFHLNVSFFGCAGRWAFLIFFILKLTQTVNNKLCSTFARLYLLREINDKHKSLIS